MQHMNPRDLFQVAEFYNNSGIRVIDRTRYLAFRELLEPQKTFEVIDRCDLGVVYREDSDDEDTPATFWVFWFTGHRFDKEIHMAFCSRFNTPHEALDCAVLSAKRGSKSEQQEAVESNQ